MNPSVSINWSYIDLVEHVTLTVIYLEQFDLDVIRIIGGQVRVL